MGGWGDGSGGCWLLMVIVNLGGRCTQVLSRGGRNTTEGSSQFHSNHRARLSVHTTTTAAAAAAVTARPPPPAAAALLGEQLGAGLSVVHATALSTTTTTTTTTTAATEQCSGQLR
eukprot:COSAG01_NODE_20484_length_951_cov_0.782864_1_plen_115_part_10